MGSACLPLSAGIVAFLGFSLYFTYCLLVVPNFYFPLDVTEAAGVYSSYEYVGGYHFFEDTSGCGAPQVCVTNAANLACTTNTPNLCDHRCEYLRYGTQWWLLQAQLLHVLVYALFVVFYLLATVERAPNGFFWAFAVPSGVVALGTLVAWILSLVGCRAYTCAAGQCVLELATLTATSTSSDVYTLFKVFVPIMLVLDTLCVVLASTMYGNSTDELNADEERVRRNAQRGAARAEFSRVLDDKDGGVAVAATELRMPRENELSEMQQFFMDAVYAQSATPAPYYNTRSRARAHRF